MALLEGNAPLSIEAQEEVPAADIVGDAPLPLPAGGAVRIVAGRPAARPVTVDCVFARAPDGGRLVALRTDGALLPLPRVFALDRFWIGSSDAAGQDPMPVADAATALRLPPHLGYPLQQAVNAIPSCAVFALLAVAYALVYGLIGRINLAFGAFAAVGGTAALLGVLAVAPYGPAAALCVAALAAMVPSAGHGAVTARLVFSPLRRATGQQGLVATIGLALVLGEYLRLAQGPDPKWIGPLLDTPFALARDESFTVTITPVAALVSALAIGVSLGLTLAMRHSGFGRNWRAYRDDPVAAALFGIGRERLLAQTIALASAFAGLAGGITVVVYGDISFAYAQVLGMKALTAAVLGGFGSISGALLGGLFIGLVESAWSAAFPIVNRDLVTFCVLVATLIWRPGGFFGDKDLVPRRI